VRARVRVTDDRATRGTRQKPARPAHIHALSDAQRQFRHTP
jgi:hypothetical protein